MPPWREHCLPRQKGRRLNADSSLGRDVSGLLASVGAFPAREAARSSGSLPRTIRLVAANQDLRLLYGPHRRDIPSLAIELAGFAVTDAAQAEKALLDYGAAYLFKLAKGTGASLRLWHSEYRLGSQRRPAYSGKVTIPGPALRHAPGRTLRGGKLFSARSRRAYLKYYQVLEFYMTKAADSVAASQGVAVETATSPLRQPPNNRLGAEHNKLDAVISLAVTQAQVMNILGDRELFASAQQPPSHPGRSAPKRGPIRPGDSRL